MKKKKYVNSGTVSMAPAPTSLLWNDSCFNYYESVGSLEEDAILCFTCIDKKISSLILISHTN